MRKLVAGLATTAALALVASTPSPAAARGGHHKSLGDKSLAAVLTSDGNQFDRNWHDYDIVTEAVLAVLASKPQSPVGILADGSAPLTAFIPTDRAFQRLVRSLTGSTPRTEREDVLTRWPGWASTPSRPSCSTTSCRRDDHLQAGAQGRRRGAEDRPGRHRHGGRPATGGGSGRCGCWTATRTPATRACRSQHQQGQQADRPRHRPGAAAARPLIRSSGWPPSSPVCRGMAPGQGH